MVILPITLLCFGFSTHSAIAHTAVYQFASTFSRVLYELMSTAGKQGKKRINFHIILLVSPLLFLGSFLGVTAQKSSPEMLILICVTVVLMFCVFMSSIKYLKNHKIEKRRKAMLSTIWEQNHNWQKSEYSEPTQEDGEGFNPFYDGGSIKSVLLSGEVISYKDKSQYKPETNNESDWDDRSDDEYDRIEYFEKKVGNGLIKLNKKGRSKHKTLTKIPDKYQLLSELPEDSIQMNLNWLDYLMLFLICSLNPAIGLLRGTQSFNSLINTKPCSL